MAKDIKTNIAESIDKRNNYLKVLTFVFDKCFPEVFPDERIEWAIKEALADGKNNIELVIATTISTGLLSMQIKDYIRDACSKKYLGLIPKQVEFLNIKIEDIIFDLTYFKIYDYENLISDVLKASTALKKFIDKYQSAGYKVEIINNYPPRSDCTIKFSWD